MLGLGRLPEMLYQPTDGISPRLQRVLDALASSPAIVKTAMWDVVGWNKAAAAMLTDYATLPREQRNILRLMFSSEKGRSRNEDWESVARFVIGALRADVARAGAHGTDEATRLVEELSQSSTEFRKLWRDNEVVAHAEGVKRIRHPKAGMVHLEFSSFSVEGRPDLGMIVYNPVRDMDGEKIRDLMQERVAG